jgi:hypothetical protein
MYLELSNGHQGRGSVDIHPLDPIPSLIVSCGLLGVGYGLLRSDVIGRFFRQGAPWPMSKADHRAGPIFILLLGVLGILASLGRIIFER